jgi:hypothetical protein
MPAIQERGRSFFLNEEVSGDISFFIPRVSGKVPYRSNKLAAGRREDGACLRLKLM